jgi:triacylglycerol lipase
MKYIDLLLLLVFYNLVPLWTSLTGVPVPARVIGTVGISIIYLVILFRSERVPLKSFRMRSLKRGISLIWLSGAALLPEWIILILYFVLTPRGAVAKSFSVVMPALATLLTLLVGIIRTAIGAKQIKLIEYVFMLLWWWVPVVNVVLIFHFYKKAKREYYFEAGKAELDSARAENEICKTRYPILMVHGIFFRDWQLFNYWGRVPAALIRNGATVYYGKQQSARSVQDSAEELRNTIMQVIEQTGAEKVNIIAHSKGGLDSRYAISQLGMDKYVATLTTINTPHGGCDMVDFLLGKVSEKWQDKISRKYNGIFGKLGDSAPDFMAGVRDLSAIRMKELNEQMPDSPDVSYRSVMSVMKCAVSAGFPLCISYLLIKKLNGANDGLVWAESAKHGQFRLIDNKSIRGISHGDVIDLMRENIEGYDVREFYTGLVAELKTQGF